jgi:hypothetical protein
MKEREAMGADFEPLPNGFERGRITRRRQLLSLPAVAMARKVIAQSAAGPLRVRALNHMTMSVSDVKRSLDFDGIKPRESQTRPVTPMRHYISLRMENRGGAKEGTPELYFTDPDGILVQLQDVRYCGGGGYLGDSCPS